MPRLWTPSFSCRHHHAALRVRLWAGLIPLILAFSPGSFAARHSARSPHPVSRTSVPTEIRVESTPWWPTSGSTDRKEYVGSSACIPCHAEKVASQTATSMGRAATRAADSQQLKAHPDLTFRLGPYAYELLTRNAAAAYSVSDGIHSTTKNLEWALGDGRFGQTYVYRERGKFYESQLSFYTRLNGLGTTSGHMEPGTLETAAGGLTTPDMIRQCFGCHSTASTTSNRFDPEAATMGVTCEACHGPGAQHVLIKSLQIQDPRDTRNLIMNPAKLNPVDSVDFCGACHRTSADAVLAGMSKMGIVNVRLQPYRLEKSKCWGSGDARLTCFACHDPHQQVVSDPGFYDAKCLACHAHRRNAKPDAVLRAACTVGTKDCVTCHMPKVEVPGTHSTFTDHWIRIARDGAPFPK